MVFFFRPELGKDSLSVQRDEPRGPPLTDVLFRGGAVAQGIGIGGLVIIGIIAFLLLGKK